MVRTKEREDYLKTIYQLQRIGSPVRTTDIARVLSVEPASVTGIIKRLAELELVIYEPYKGATLSESGMKVALEIIRNHRLIELYLVEALGYTWDEVHDEAERLEHAVSPLFIERIEAALGYPSTDPHGSPIPTKDGTISRRSELPLASLSTGQTGQVSRVVDEDPHLLRYLDGLGLHPGTIIRVLDVPPYSGSIQIEANGESKEIGTEAAQQIFIEPTPK